MARARAAIAMRSGKEDYDYGKALKL